MTDFLPKTTCGSEKVANEGATSPQQTKSPDSKLAFVGVTTSTKARLRE
jgi:hypothetical protein